MIKRNLNDYIFDVDSSEILRPNSRIRVAENLEERIVTVAAQVVPPTKAASVPSTQAGTPLQVTGLTATESPIKQIDRTFSQVAVSFTRDANDKAFLGVKVWAKGYRGNTGWVAITDAHDSPATFLMETTGETIVIKAQAFGVNIADFDAAPTTTVLLDGVISAPPAPSISQALIAIALGFQFSFNQLSGLAADVVDSYRIYRNSANSFGGATLIQTIKHSPTNVGAVVVQDNVGSGVTYYYWVTAVNTSGLESSATATGAAQSNVNLPQNQTNNATVDSIDAGGGHATIRVYGPSGVGNGWTLYIGSRTFSMPYITITGQSYTTHYFIYCNADGSSPSVATTAFPTLPDNLVLVGTVTTVASGGGGGTGGGGGNLGACFTGNVEICVPGGTARFDSLPTNFMVETAKGTRLALLITHLKHSGPMHDMGDGLLVTPDHPFKHGDGWRPASEQFAECPVVQFNGTVYTLHVLDTDEDTHNFKLAAGGIAHNSFAMVK